MKNNVFHPNRTQMNAGMIRLMTFKEFLDIANLVLTEQAQLGHDDLIIFDTEMDNALGDFIYDKEKTLARIKKMVKETGIRTKIVGTHVITIDEMEMDD